MTTLQAVQSLLVGLSRREPTMLIGLDGDHPHIRRHRSDVTAAAEAIRVYYAAPRAIPAAELDAVPLEDEFGTRSRPAFVHLAGLPRTSSGEIAFDELARTAARGTRRLPGTIREKQVATIWSRVLATASIGLDDNFFDLGGDSLLAARVLGEIRDELGVELTLRQLFDAARLEDFVRVVEAAAPVPRDPETAAAASGGARFRDLLERLDDLGDDEVDALLDELDQDRVVGG
jgi:acyl carrier protein